MEHTNAQLTNADDIISYKGPIQLESDKQFDLTLDQEIDLILDQKVDLTLDQAKEEITKLNKEIFILKRKLEEKNEGNIKAIYY